MYILPPLSLTIFTKICYNRLSGFIVKMQRVSAYRNFNIISMRLKSFICLGFHFGCVTVYKTLKIT
ncbi:hypothetical protein Hanom_Chr06g00550871 [Helianthus anomalus]